MSAIDSDLVDGADRWSRYERDRLRSGRWSRCEHDPLRSGRWGRYERDRLRSRRRGRMDGPDMSMIGSDPAPVWEIRSCRWPNRLECSELC
eukprot:1897513-Pyramimonas_sp.AAC.2